MEEGAFMDTFLGQLVTTITLGISVLLILWEIYLNTLLGFTFIELFCTRCLRSWIEVVPACVPNVQPAEPADHGGRIHAGQV